MQLDNQRKRVLTLTFWGLSLLRRTDVPAEVAYERLMAPVDPTQCTAFLGLLQQLVRADSTGRCNALKTA